MPPTSPRSPIRLELVQFSPKKGAVEENLARMAALAVERAGEVDLLVFPETALSGYFLEGGVEGAARTVQAVVEGLGSPPADAPDLVLGFYEAGDGPIRNSALWLTPEGDRYRPVHLHRKTFLPTYRIFDEARFVSPGLELRAFDTRFGRVGLLICEEMFHSLAPTILALEGAHLLVTLAASPGRDLHPGPGFPGNLEMWDVAGRSITQEHGVYLAVAHLLGSEGGKLFPGGSAVYGPGGTVLARGPVYEEARVAHLVDPERVRREQLRSPLLEDLRIRLPHLTRALNRAGSGENTPAGEGAVPLLKASEGDPREREVAEPPSPREDGFLAIDPELVERALLAFLRHEVRERRGFTDVVVGVSGGVDSAVTLALAARAFGPERVHAFLLPYATSSPESLEHGKLILEVTGVRGRTIPISPGVDAYVDAEEPEVSDLRRGNLAARFRALVLWDQAARVRGIPLGTGNKSERLLGYFTWHADDSPPVNPIGDLYKTQVLALARHLGVPEPILRKAPSADLVRGVHDEDEIGVPYALADRILHWLVSGYSASELVRGGFDTEAVERVRSRLEGTHWKRKLPTVAVLSSSAIGEFYLRPVDL